MKGWRSVLAGCLSLAVLSACTPQPSEPSPPEIIYGQDVCDACGMIISQARFAAAAALENGETLKFDDIGDMLHYQASHPDLEVAAWFVHDHPSETWLPAAEASYVVSPAIASPMGHALAAFADPAEAASFAVEVEGQVLTWEETRLRFQEP
jgi:copper chaperone NosL